MLYRLKQAIPEGIKAPYHYGLAKISAALYGHPSEKMVVIGVTGTNGKSSTVLFIAQLLEDLGETVGYTTTAGFRIAGKDIENRMKMTMPGRMYLQQMLRRMYTAGCTVAIVETSSQGIAQYRHVGINYDVAVFTNLTPEHIEAHGGFEAYKAAKGKLFEHLGRSKRKYLRGKTYQKVSVLNADDEHVPFFSSFDVDERVFYSWQRPATVRAERGAVTPNGVEATVNGLPVRIPMPAEFQQKNVLAAAATLVALHYSLEDILACVERLQGLPGRFELVDMGQPFTVIVDYAYEPYAIQALLDAVKARFTGKIIGVHGSAGGGRDVARREQIGRLAAKEEDIVIVTNEDPYDEDPRVIIEAVAEGARLEGAVQGKDLFLVDDRQEAIDKAIQLAGEGDVVLLTGKGSEPVIAVAEGKKIPWSDVQAAKEALQRRFL